MTMPFNKTEFKNHIDKKQYDLFICSSSFEKRCLTIPQIAIIESSNVLICHYKDTYEIANNHLVTLKNINKESQVIYMEKNNPINNIDLIYNVVLDSERKSSPLKVLIDISTFSHEMILILTYLFREIIDKKTIEVYYTYNSAKDYSIDKKEISKKWLSRGVREIRTVLGYPGRFSLDKKSALVVLVGIEEERVLKLIEEFQPNKVLLGFATKDGAINQKLKEIHDSVYNQIKSILSIDVEQFDFSCKTPYETEESLNSVFIQLKNEYNITVAALNNKISTIGVALSAIEHSEVQMCYPTVNQYNFLHYSVPSDEIYLFNINEQ
jgi:hypothetical protein